MFGIDELREEVRELKASNRWLLERVEQLEKDTEPFRVGDLSPYFLAYPGWADSRPRISVHQALCRIMAHLNIQFTATKAVPETVQVEKVK